MPIIALTGPKGSGKDSLATSICNQGHNARTIAFADPIKKVVQHLFDLDPSSVEQYDKFKRTRVNFQLDGYLSHSVDARHLVREIGMLMRGYDVNQFITYVLNECRHDPTKLWIVTDLRFDNEYEMIRHLNGRVIKIEREGFYYDGHVTEQGFDDSSVDYKILNQGSLADIDIHARTLLNSLREEGFINETHFRA